MGGLLNALNAGRQSLEVNQKSLEVVGNNISNINTEGYSRQEAVLEPYPSLNFGGFFIGQGVKISDVSREHDVFIEEQIKEKSADFGTQDSMSLPLSELESIFNVTDNNLSSDIDTFFDSLQQLSADPSDIGRPRSDQRSTWSSGSIRFRYSPGALPIGNPRDDR